MNLYLDDWRTPPRGENWCSADNYADFIMLLDKYAKCLEIVDLDYDLGYDSLFNGLSVLKYMKKYGITCKHINVHSSHPIGRESMMLYASMNFDGVEITG